MILTHFSAVCVFSLFTAVVFGITQRAAPKLMIRFGMLTFFSLVGLTIAASWVMFLIKR